MNIPYAANASYDAQNNLKQIQIELIEKLNNEIAETIKNKCSLGEQQAHIDLNRDLFIDRNHKKPIKELKLILDCLRNHEYRIDVYYCKGRFILEILW